MTSTPSRTLLPIVLGAAALAAASPAAATPTVHRHQFTVALEGRQTTTWTYKHDDSGECDAAQSGSGTETIRFRGRATKVVAFEAGEVTNFLGNDGHGADMALRGTVTRQGGVITAPVGPGEDCADGTGAGQTPASDCGTKPLSRITVEPNYEYRRDRIHLTQTGSAGAPDFAECPVFGSTYPQLMDVTTRNNRFVDQELPPHDLFTHGQNVIVATGVDRGDDSEAQWTTRIRWTLDFKRTKRERA